MLRDAEILAELLETAISKEDLNSMEQITSAFVDSGWIDAVAVLGSSGELRVQSGETDLFADGAAAWAPESEGIISHHRGESVLQMPIGNQGSGLGSIIAVAGKGPSNASPWKDLGLSLAAILIIMSLIRKGAENAGTPIRQLVESLKLAKVGSTDVALRKIGRIEPEAATALKTLIGEYEQLVAKSQELAMRDAMTGLTNRSNFIRIMDNCIKQCGERAVVLSLIDINRFKRLNDMLGVRTADEVLAVMGARLGEALKEADERYRHGVCETMPCVAGRLSGDQFAVLIPMADDFVAERVMRQAAKAFQVPVQLSGSEVEVTATLAAAATPRDAKTAAELLKQAETALEKAKSEKAKGLFFYNRQMAEEARARIQLENDIRRGVANNEFVAVFQPKVHLDTMEITGAEALARWRKPDGVMVSPGEFIPVAEQMGLISELGASVLRDACMEAARWERGDKPVRLAVNVSPHQFDDPEFIPSVYASLNDSGLPPELLELEITESVAVENPDRVAKVMRPLRSRGVRLAIDDFGTGHSNFETVTRLPFDVFKIDQQFVRALDVDPHAPAIVEMILAMAQALGQETVAEGVETAAQYSFLKARSCTIGQGFHFAPPLPGHEFQLFVEHWRTRRAKQMDAALA